jgi:hypothetical protein
MMEVLPDIVETFGAAYLIQDRGCIAAVVLPIG